MSSNSRKLYKLKLEAKEEDMSELLTNQLALVAYVFILPIVLGIVTTIVAFMGRTYFNDTVMPWYKDKTDRTHTVRGPWKALTNPEYATGRKYEETIYIQQLSEKIWGDIFYKEIIDGNEEETVITEKHFEFMGTFADSVFSATYWNPDRERKGRGTFCLYSDDSDLLKGKYSWYDPETKEVEAGDYVWKRQKT